MGGHGLDWTGSEQVAGCCKCSNEPVGSIKCGESLDYIVYLYPQQIAIIIHRPVTWTTSIHPVWCNVSCGKLRSNLQVTWENTEMCINFEEFRQVSRSESNKTDKERKMFNETNFIIYTLHCCNTRTDAATRFHVTQERRNNQTMLTVNHNRTWLLERWRINLKWIL
jgi:hypothetical protein